MRRSLSPFSSLLPLLLLAVQARGADLPNVLLITVDTFRPDHMGCMGYPRKTTPNLDRIASEGVLFTQAISSSSWTTPGLMSVLTGLHAPSHGVDARDKSLPPGAPTLPRLLKPLGYASPDICYLTVIPNFAGLGFEGYAPRDSLLQRGDEVLFRCLEDFRDRRFFIYYHYRDLHLPYAPQPPYDRMFAPEGFDPTKLPDAKRHAVMEDVMIPFGQVTFDEADRGWITGLYDGQIREMDELFFGRLEETLTRAGLKENTLLIVTADHGEELLDHGFVGHASTSLRGTSYDELIRIPLVLRYPGRLPAGRRVTAQVQNIDVAPTVLEVLGAQIPAVLQGRSLLPTIRGEAGWRERPAFCETTPGGYQASPEMLRTRIRSMRTSAWKLIRTAGPSVDETELFDLKEDPGERRNLAKDRPETVSRMRTALDRWAREANRRGRKENTPAEVAKKREEEPPSQRGGPRIVAAAGGVEERQGKNERMEAEEGLNPQSAIRNPQSDAPVRVLFPGEGDTLRFEATRGAILPRWEGDSSGAYVVQYRVGQGSHHLEGEIGVKGSAQKYGPFGQTVWNTLALYNPWQFRVRPEAEVDRWTGWRTFHVAPAGRSSPAREAAASRMAGVLLGVRRVGWWIAGAGGVLILGVLGWAAGRRKRG